uniref:Cytochrome b561 family member D2 n=1 Tax=Equus caballus TaxID=9796 RepID=A0A9L0SYB3_HORSE
MSGWGDVAPGREAAPRRSGGARSKALSIPFSREETTASGWRCGLQPPAWLTMALSVETESHIYRALRTASGAAAHLVALGFTIFVAVLARPGSTCWDTESSAEA